jgi:hypothetical protein
MRCDEIVVPIESRRPDIFIQIHQAVRLQRPEHVREKFFELRHVVRRLVKERDVVRATFQLRIIEIAESVGHAIGDSFLPSQIARHFDRPR